MLFSCDKGAAAATSATAAATSATAAATSATTAAPTTTAATRDKLLELLCCSPLLAML
jgi:hypothetical protein